MEFVKILNYVEKSFGNKPAFILLMSNNKEYIIIGHMFVENTKENIEELIADYDCSMELIELFVAPSMNIRSVTNAGYMLNHSKLESFDPNMGSITDASYMVKTL